MSLLSLSSAQNVTSPKRGLAYIGSMQTPDTNLLNSPASPISWYYNWSPYPATNRIPRNDLEFVPLIHGIDGAESSQTARVISSLPENSRHLLTFNEPDGTTDSGGSAIEPEDAARAYIEHIVPYREGKKGNREWLISHPSSTGSGRGLDWLRAFNESCYKIDEDNGCPTDFIAAHWYGALDGLQGWLGTLDEFYNGEKGEDEPRLKIWVTEMALPQADAEATAQMINVTLPWLDGEDMVERYAWFGAFRTDDANEWTGDGVALFDDDGGLTEVGALYLGGDENGFKKGQKGEGAAAGLRVSGAVGCLFVFGALMVNIL